MSSVGPDWPPREHTHELTLDGFRLRAVILGEGPPLLAIHGTGASSHSFAGVGQLLKQQFTVIAPELPGHAGTSTPASFVPSLRETSRILSRLLRELELRPTVAVGHSAGAAVVMQMALDRTIHPDLIVGIGAALVPFRGISRRILPTAASLLANAGPTRWLATKAGTRRVREVLRSTGTEPSAAVVRRYQKLASQPEHLRAVLAMMAAWELEPLFHRLGQVRSRCVLLAGEHDQAVPFRDQERAVRRLLDAKTVVIPNGGHLFHEEQPELV
ncbi:MAG: alpha/beta fold hydrolase BchO, partial [Myxococcota bacterium]